MAYYEQLSPLERFGHLGLGIGKIALGLGVAVFGTPAVFAATMEAGPISMIPSMATFLGGIGLVALGLSDVVKAASGQIMVEYEPDMPVFYV